MATRMLTLTGPVKWARLFEENRDMHEFHKPYDGAYLVNIGLDDDQWKKLQDAGFGGKAKSEEGDDLHWVRLKRKHHDRYDWSSGAPKVFDSMDSPWDMETNGEIGNDSILEVLVSVYDTAYSNCGSRLEKAKVLDLVEPVRKEDLEDEVIHF